MTCWLPPVGRISVFSVCFHSPGEFVEHVDQLHGLVLLLLLGHSLHRIRLLLLHYSCYWVYSTHRYETIIFKVTLR